MESIRGIPYEAIYRRLKANGMLNGKKPKSKERCHLCHDTGYISIFNADGFSVKPCKCLARIKMEARLKKSGIKMEEYAKYSFKHFLADTQTHSEMLKMAHRYLKGRRPGEGIGYFGDSGTGKTHICIAICQELTRQYGEEHYYFSYRTEIQRVKAVMYSDADQYNAMISHWSTVDNLYIDDLFKFATKDGRKNGDIQPQDLQIMFDIINARYLNNKATLFSSEYALNYIISDIDQALGSRISAMTPYKMGSGIGNVRLKGMEAAI